MNCVFWNVRGIVNSPSKLALKRLIISNKPDFVFIVEPWIEVTSLPHNWLKRLNLKTFTINTKGNNSPDLWSF